LLADCKRRLSAAAFYVPFGRIDMGVFGDRLLEFQWGGVPYWGVEFGDDVGGCTGMELHQTIDGVSAVVAKLTYWDATGEYVFETLGVGLPLGVIDKLVAATKSLVAEAVIGPS
jgi:hypothetical protein